MLEQHFKLSLNSLLMRSIVMTLPEFDNLKAFDVSIENNIAHLKLKRADQFNSMNSDFWEELPRIVKAIDHASAARVIVLSSTGKHFTAGMDLDVLNSKLTKTKYDESLIRLFESSMRYQANDYITHEEAIANLISKHEKCSRKVNC